MSKIAETAGQPERRSAVVAAVEATTEGQLLREFSFLLICISIPGIEMPFA